MCTICGTSPCLVRCPNYAPKTLHKCSHCGLDITTDDEYLSYYNDKYYHADCLADMTGDEIAEMLDMQIERGA